MADAADAAGAAGAAEDARTGMDNGDLQPSASLLYTGKLSRHF